MGGGGGVGGSGRGGGGCAHGWSMSYASRVNINILFEYARVTECVLSPSPRQRKSTQTHVQESSQNEGEKICLPAKSENGCYFSGKGSNN